MNHFKPIDFAGVTVKSQNSFIIFIIICTMLPIWKLKTKRLKLHQETSKAQLKWLNLFIFYKSQLLTCLF